MLPVAETQQLVDQLPPQLAVYKQRSLIDCMPPVLKQTVLPPQRDTAIESAAVPDGADASLVPVESAALPQHAVAATARDGVVATDGFYENLQRIGTNHINRYAFIIFVSVQTLSI